MSPRPRLRAGKKGAPRGPRARSSWRKDDRVCALPWVSPVGLLVCVHRRDVTAFAPSWSERHRVVVSGKDWLWKTRRHLVRTRWMVPNKNRAFHATRAWRGSLASIRSMLAGSGQRGASGANSRHRLCRTCSPSLSVVERVNLQGFFLWGKWGCSWHLVEWARRWPSCSSPSA